MQDLFKIQRAIKFATKTHEIYQKQKRKGKDVSYITHPLTVGILLSSIGADVDVVCAGILHDTIEDSIEEKKVTAQMLTDRFGEKVAELVLAVTETDKSLSWEKRKEQALEHIKTFSHEAILVKSADIVSNLTEMVDDHNKEGDQIFQRFNASKDRKIKNILETNTALLEAWPESPLAQELSYLSGRVQMMGAKEFMVEFPAKIIEYANYKEDEKIECPLCNWKSEAKSGSIEHYDELMDVSCPNCDKMLLVINYPYFEPKNDKNE